MSSVLHKCCMYVCVRIGITGRGKSDMKIP